MLQHVCHKIWTFFLQIVEVSGTPFYGYHPREHRFFKVTWYTLIQWEGEQLFLSNEKSVEKC